MLNGLKIAVIMPAYNAAATLKKTYASLPKELIDDVILTDDFSTDETVELSRSLGIHTIIHTRTRDMAAIRRPATTRRSREAPTSSSCFTPTTNIRLVSCRPLPRWWHRVNMTSRSVRGFSGRERSSGGMPLYKYVSNRFLTFVQNVADRTEDVRISHGIPLLEPQRAERHLLSPLLG